MIAILVSIALIAGGVGIFIGANLAHTRNQYNENLLTIQRNLIKDIILQHQASGYVHEKTIKTATLILIQSIDNEDFEP